MIPGDPLSLVPRVVCGAAITVAVLGCATSPPTPSAPALPRVETAVAPKPTRLAHVADPTCRIRGRRGESRAVRLSWEGSVFARFAEPERTDLRIAAGRWTITVETAALELTADAEPPLWIVRRAAGGQEDDLGCASATVGVHVVTETEASPAPAGAAPVEGIAEGRSARPGYTCADAVTIFLRRGRETIAVGHFKPNIRIEQDLTVDHRAEEMSIVLPGRPEGRPPSVIPFVLRKSVERCPVRL